jgi:hypothetical protein
VLQYSQAYSSTFGTQQCGLGGSFNEYEDSYLVSFNHNNPTLTIVMTTTLNNLIGQESWGFREF